PTHAVVLEQPVERRPVVALRSEYPFNPHVWTIGVGPAGLVSHQAESRTRVRRRHLLVPGEAIQPLETADVAVAPIEEADLAGGTDPEAVGDQIPGVERDAEHHLRAAGQVDAAAHAEPEQPEVGAATPRRSYLGRMELLGGEPGEYARGEQRGQPHRPHQVPFPRVSVARARAAARP